MWIDGNGTYLCISFHWCVLVCRMYDLQSTEGDPLLDTVMDVVHPDKIDSENEKRRSHDRHQALYSIYPMPEEVKLSCEYDC